ncbi:MAG: ankyrin repeat domain-containing protein, partial [Gammaproteobacteria bacterium]|nr:ankyrin repeat domain-containing protein [Gammaproteobacteria bacterium]
ANVSQVDKRTYANTNLYCEQKFALHFPHLYKKFKAEKNKRYNWSDQFNKAYETEYEEFTGGLARVRLLISYIKEGNLVEVKKLFKSGEFKLNHLEICDKNNTTLLTWAKINKHQALLDYFYQLEKNKTLRLAILYHQSDETIKALITPENINGTPLDGKNPLRHAVIEDEVRMVKMLLSQGAMIDAASPTIGATPLLLAVEKGNKEIVDILLAHKANVSIRLGYQTNYHYQYKVNTGDTPLHAAAILGHDAIAAALLDKGANINATSLSSSNTPLIYATKYGHTSTVELLIKNGAEIDKRSACGATPLLFAVENNNKEVVKILLENMADVSIPLQTNGHYHHALNVHESDTPLHAAAILDHVEIAENLLDHEANIEGLSAFNSTPLICAAKFGQLKMTKFLIERGANVNARTTRGATPLLFAVENGHTNIVKVLLENKADVSIPLEVNSHYHDEFNVKAGDTPLHAATKLARIPIIRYLLKYNANIECKNAQQQTPIDVAKENWRYTNELKLLAYSAKTSRLPADDIEKYEICGQRFNVCLFGTPSNAKQREAAAKAVIKVVFEGENESSLKEHAAALNQGELNDICQSLKLR